MEHMGYPRKYVFLRTKFVFIRKVPKSSGSMSASTLMYTPAVNPVSTEPAPGLTNPAPEATHEGSAPCFAAPPEPAPVAKAAAPSSAAPAPSSAMATSPAPSASTFLDDPKSPDVVVVETVPALGSYHPDNQLGLLGDTALAEPAATPPDTPAEAPMSVEPAPGATPKAPETGVETPAPTPNDVAAALTRATTVDLLSPTAPPGSVASEVPSEVPAGSGVAPATQEPVKLPKYLRGSDHVEVYLMVIK